MAIQKLPQSLRSMAWFLKKADMLPLRPCRAGSRDAALRPALSRGVFKGQPGDFRTVTTALSSFVPTVLLVRSLQLLSS